MVINNRERSREIEGVFTDCIISDRLLCWCGKIEERRAVGTAAAGETDVAEISVSIDGVGSDSRVRFCPR